ncbi:MAG: CRISPR-associated endonuclease Cas1 [Patescibacteria group bacterium]|nr:CRISPR-associated endonuclease Cas1 [Patescibacteria group bacterium]
MSYNRKKYLWLPYLKAVQIKPKTVAFIYKGGITEIDWVKIHSIMIYGDSCDLPVELVDKCAFYKIPIVFHRRNLARASLILPSPTGETQDLLGYQVRVRDNLKKRTYIAKRLVLAKFKGMTWLVPSACDYLFGVANLQKIRNIEAWHARRYWQEYFTKLGLEKKRRESNNEVQKALNAVSKFVVGIVLRWVLYHNLSPYHGFLHQPTDYPALIYDLIEPYRGYFDRVVFEAYREMQENSKDRSTSFVAMAIEKIKDFLEKKIYVHSTRQIATFHELLHGVVLSLRVYLLGETRRFVVPLPDQPKGGRPIKAFYKLYGRTAGVTDFWEQAKKLSLQVSTSSVTN